MSCFSPGLSGMVISASLASNFVNGRNSSVTTTLNNVWKFAISPIFIVSFHHENPTAAFTP